MRNLLVLLLGEGSRSRLQRAIAERGDGPANVHIVAPTRIGPLEWLASDEDHARAEAAVRALDAEWTLTGEAEVEAEPGDVDPVLAVEDALRNFQADEILLVGAPGEDGGLEASLQRFGVLVTRLEGSRPARRADPLREWARALAGGRSKATPFVFFVAANLALFALAALIALFVLLVLWLL
ncbi:MAG TPA: hypothetical protein VGJ23_00075 [Gaiellaceae bacterium]|jgi:hypothetical protein